MKGVAKVGDKRPRSESSTGPASQPQVAAASSGAEGKAPASKAATPAGDAVKKSTSNWDMLKKKLTTNTGSSSATTNNAGVSSAIAPQQGDATRPAQKKRRLDLKKAVSIAERKGSSAAAVPASETIEEEIAKSEAFVAKSRYVGLDCEMVGIGASGKQSALARCCLIDFDGNVIFDEYVKPPGFVTDFRTKYSGIRKKDISGDNAISLQECQAQVADLLKGKVLVGHALKNDLDALMLKHPRSMIRDTALYRPYQRPHGRKGGKFKPRALRDLSKQFLKLEIQTGEHDPSEDARCAMLLYRRDRRAWEASLTAAVHGGSSKGNSTAATSAIGADGSAAAVAGEAAAAKKAKKKPMNKNKKYQERAEAARLKAEAAAVEDPSIITRRAGSSKNAGSDNDDEDDDVPRRRPVEYPDIHIVDSSRPASSSSSSASSSSASSSSSSPELGAAAAPARVAEESGAKQKHRVDKKFKVKKRSQMFAS